MANKVYVAQETPVTFRDSGGDVVLTLQNLGFGAGRVSARYDRNTGSKPARHKVRATFQFETAPIAGETLELYIFESDGTSVDGNVGTSDAALTSANRNNGTFVGAVVVPSTATATDITASFTVYIYSRYYSVGVWNASAGDNLKNTANVSFVTVTPIPDEVQ